jgi:hypothetical protein
VCVRGGITTIAKISVWTNHNTNVMGSFEFQRTMPILVFQIISWNQIIANPSYFINLKRAPGFYEKTSKNQPFFGWLFDFFNFFWESSIMRVIKMTVDLWFVLKILLDYFFLNLDLHTTLPPSYVTPSYPTNLTTLFTYILALLANYNQPLTCLFSILSWLNTLLLAKT